MAHEKARLQGEYQITLTTPWATLRETGEARHLCDHRRVGRLLPPATEGATFVKARDTSGGSFSAVLAEARKVIENAPG